MGDGTQFIPTGGVMNRPSIVGRLLACLAPNTTDEGRAKNRRVEIANTACQPKRP